MRNRILAILLSISMLIGMMPMTVFAGVERASEITEIATAEEFASADMTKGGEFKLTADITLPSDWTPKNIDNEAVFDGSGHSITVSGKPVFKQVGSSPDYITAVDATVKNLALKGEVSDNGFESSAPLAKTVYGTVRNCVSYADSKGLEWSDASGLVDKVDMGKVFNTVVYGNVTVDGSFCTAHGIARATSADTGEKCIVNCYWTGDAANASSSNGYVENSRKVTVQETVASGFVSEMNSRRADGDLEWVVKDGKLGFKAEEDPSIIKIATAEEFASADMTKGGEFKLTADITLPSDWTPKNIDNEAIFDGAGHSITVSGKPVFEQVGSSPDYITAVDATVKNLALKGEVSDDGFESSAPLAKKVYGTVRNCVSYADSKGLDWSDASGLVDKIDMGTVSNSVVYGQITVAGSFCTAHGIARATSADTGEKCIVNCYWTGDPANASSSNGYVENSRKVTVQETVASGFVSEMNSRRANGDLEWVVKDGKLALKGGSGEAGPAETPENVAKSELREAIKVAELLDRTDYTADSFAKVTEAVDAANAELEKEDATVESLNEKKTAIEVAISGLVLNIPTEAVATPDDESLVTKISSEDDLKSIGAGEKGHHYVLEEDITINGKYYFNPVKFKGVLDGKGHTITLDNSVSIFDTVEKTGVIQNVHFAGLLNHYTPAGPIAKSVAGAIINCYSDVEDGMQKFAAGFTGTLDGGIISNCYSISTASKGILFANYNSGTVKNTYWTKGALLPELPEDALVSSEGKTADEMKTKDFVELLNTNRGENGTKWGQNDTGYPYFGEDKEFKPEEDAVNKYDVLFTPNLAGKDPVTISKEDANFTVSPDDVYGAGKIAGAFSLVGAEGTPEWSISDTVPSGAMLINMSKGNLHVYDEGTAVVKATIDGEVVATIKVTSKRKAIEDMKIFIGDTDVTDGTYEIQGSETKEINAKVKFEGESEYVAQSATRFTFEHDSEELINGAAFVGDNSFSFKKPGTAKFTVTSVSDTTKKAEVTVTSVYVPVESIKPSVQDEVLHSRNANSEGGASFTPYKTTVEVLPENASNRGNYTVESSDPEVAEFVPSMVIGYVPYKAGTVTYTATIKDEAPDGTVKEVKGSKTVTYSYKNPLKSVSLEKDSFYMVNGTSEKLDLSFAKTDENLYITEPGMIWSFSDEDIIEITQKKGAWGQEGTSWGFFPSTEFTMEAVGVGTVTVTGTPIDNTAGAKPITFTVKVVNGAGDLPADNNKITADAIEGAHKYFDNKGNNYEFGFEWEIFSLIRSGKTVNDEKIASYLDSVEKTYTGEVSTSDLKPTTLARVALTLTVLGEDAENFRGVNFVDLLTKSDRMTNGSNEPAWTLIALDSSNYRISKDATWTRSKLINEILTKYQAENGAFGLTDNKSGSVDMTGMVIQALAPYYNKDAKVKAAVDRGVEYLKSQMDRNCGFGGSVESAAQVLVALTSIGIDPVDPANGFVKSESKNIITNINSFRNSETGGFKHQSSDSFEQDMSTVQALYAFDSYRRFVANENNLYDLTDVNRVGALKNKIKEANELNKNEYTENTWSELEKALENANAVVAKENATAEEISDAYSALVLAMSNLKIETITVSFRLIGDSLHGEEAADHEKYQEWIPTFKLEVKKGSTVKDAFLTALEKHGMKSTIRGGNYVVSVTAPESKGGYTLGEFDNGPYSGWKYLVNGKYPEIGFSTYPIEDGDSIVWRYVDNYRDEYDNNDKWQEVDKVDPPEHKHNWDKEFTIDKEATCTKDGQKSIHCSGCDEVKNVTVIKALGHKTSTKITKATPSHKGSIVTTCAHGDYTKKTTIARISVSQSKLSFTSARYNGKYKKPSVTVKNVNGKTISRENYSVTYSKNKNVGIAKVTVTFKGSKYSGTITKTFKIVPVMTSISKLTSGKKAFTVKWYKKSPQVTGYEVRYSTNSKFTKYKTARVTSYKTTSKTISKLSSKKKYYVKIRTYKTVGNVKYYSRWTDAKSVTTK